MLTVPTQSSTLANSLASQGVAPPMPQAATKTTSAAPSVKTAIMVISPEMAAEWLKKNKGNRTPSRSAIKKYASDMQAGRWSVTGDAIRFDSNGDLIDGQHRLLACLSANTNFESLIISDLPNEVRHQMDLGVRRTPGNILEQMGVAQGTRLAAAITQLISISDGTDVRGRITTPMIVEICQQHPRLAEAVAIVYGGDPLVKDGFVGRRSIIGASPAHIAAVYYAAAYLLGEKERADEYLSVFKTGIPNYPGDPAHAFRERLLRLRSTGTPLTRGAQLRGLCGSWNQFRIRKPTGKFNIPDSYEIDGLSPGFLNVNLRLTGKP